MSVSWQAATTAGKSVSRGFRRTRRSVRISTCGVSPAWTSVLTLDPAVYPIVADAAILRRMSSSCSAEEIACVYVRSVVATSEWPSLRRYVRGVSTTLGDQPRRVAVPEDVEARPRDSDVVAGVGDRASCVALYLERS